ncbi:MAG TPA: hypothetical protein VIF39_07915, partial [Hyphomicrobium sp.]
MLVENLGTAFRIVPGPPWRRVDKSLHPAGVEHAEQAEAERTAKSFLITLLRQLEFSVRTNIEHFVFGEEATMARNKVQLQKGLCETDFDAQYGSEERCHA